MCFYFIEESFLYDVLLLKFSIPNSSEVFSTPFHVNPNPLCLSKYMMGFSKFLPFNGQSETQVKMADEAFRDVRMCKEALVATGFASDSLDFSFIDRTQSFQIS